MTLRHRANTEHPLVSVVIPCLNRAHFLVPTIESVLKQDYPYIECIVVDGGSTDDTLEILMRYGDRIRWISEPDNGHADAINKGWRISKGDILAWLNADDLWALPDAISQAVAYLEAHSNVDVVYGDCGSVDANGNVVGMVYPIQWNLEYAVEYCDHVIYQAASFMRRRTLENVGWCDPTFISKKDHELWLRIGLVGNIKYIPVLLAYTRACPGYMAERGDVTAAACVALTNKFFGLPGVPKGLLSKRRRALSNAHLVGAFWAWADGRHARVVLRYLLQSLFSDPSNFFRVLRQFERLTWAELARRPSLWRPLWSLWLSVRRYITNLYRPHEVERSWVMAQVYEAVGEALLLRDGRRDSKDFSSVVFRTPPQLRVAQWDIRNIDALGKQFDFIINFSATAYLGVGSLDPDADLKAVGHMKTLLNAGGRMLMTIPVGQEKARPPHHRVYGVARLPKLLEGWQVVEEEYWIKDGRQQWLPVEESVALRHPWTRSCHALGFFVLEPNTGRTLALDLPRELCNS